jgi:hypothetical protein
MSDGRTTVVPAMIPGTEQTVTLLATDESGTHAQIGVKRPAVPLLRGETAEIMGLQVTLNDFDVVMPSREGGSVKIFANAHVDMDGQPLHIRPGVISRPGTEELETIEAPIGRSGLNLVLERVDPNEARAYFQVAPAPQEYLYAEVSLKPFIGLLWVGTGLTVLGLMLATIQRGRMANKLQAATARDEKLEIKKNGKRAAA